MLLDGLAMLVGDQLTVRFESITGVMQSAMAGSFAGASRQVSSSHFSSPHFGLVTEKVKLFSGSGKPIFYTIRKLVFLVSPPSLSNN